MGAPGSGEFPWQPAASSRPQAQEGLGLCPGVFQNTRGPVAFLPTDQASSPRDSRAPVLGHRRVGAGVPSTSHPLLRSVRHVPRAPLRCGLQTPPEAPPGSRPDPPGRGGGRGATQGPGGPGRARAAAGPPREAGGRVCKCPRGGRGPPPAPDKSSGRGAAQKPLPPGSRPCAPTPCPPAARPRGRRLPVRTRGGSGTRGGGGRGGAETRGTGAGRPAHAGPPSRAALSRWEPENQRLRGALPGAGQVASPQLLRRARLSPGHRRSRPRGTASVVPGVRRDRGYLGVE